MLAIRQVFMWLSFFSSCYMWSPFDQTACTLSLCQGIQTFSPTILRGCVILTGKITSAKLWPGVLINPLYAHRAPPISTISPTFVSFRSEKHHWAPKDTATFSAYHEAQNLVFVSQSPGDTSEQGGLGLIISCCNYLSGIIAATHWNLNTGSINRTRQQLVSHWRKVNLCSWILNFTNRLACLVKYTPILNSTFDNSY